MNTQLKLIIFDWDDVFTHGSTDGYYSCYKAAADRVAPDTDFEHVKRVVKELWGRPARDVIVKILGDQAHRVEEVNGYYEECLFSDTFLNNISFIDGGQELFHRLSQKYKLAIATGMHPKLLKEHVMPKFGISQDLFVQIMSIYDLLDQSRGKPHPDMIEVILSKQKINPTEAIMVGDAPGDMNMAFAAHVEPIAVLTGHLSEEQAKNLGVKNIIPRVTDIESVLNT